MFIRVWPRKVTHIMFSIIVPLKLFNFYMFICFREKRILILLFFGTSRFYHCHRCSSHYLKDILSVFFNLLVATFIKSTQLKWSLSFVLLNKKNRINMFYKFKHPMNNYMQSIFDARWELSFSERGADILNEYQIAAFQDSLTKCINKLCNVHWLLNKKLIQRL